METKVNVTEIQKLAVKGKIVEEPVEGGQKGETERKLITQVSFEYDGAPGVFDSVLWALTAGHNINAVFASPQASFDHISDQEATLRKGSITK